jgi:RimJ/RimL family protein N-acetyltransferase
MVAEALAEQPSIWRGERIRLRAIEPDDWETYHAWNFDDELTRNLWYPPLPQSREAGRRWAEAAAVAQHDGDDFRFAIESLATGRVVGDLTTQRCDRRVGTFTYGIGIKDGERRRGYAAEAIRLVLRYYFEELRYQKAWVGVHDFNDASRLLHERLGFRQEGRQRRMVYTRGRYFDLLLFGLTAEEFAAHRAPGAG